ncbi:MAG: hypothetical protein WCY62_02340 [Clostridia bacterium]
MENVVSLVKNYGKKITCIIEMQEPVSNDLTDANTYMKIWLSPITITNRYLNAFRN